MRSQLQLHCQCFRRHCYSSQSRKIQGICREIWFGSCVGDSSGQICVRHGQVSRDVRSRKMERPRGNCAMLGLLDCSTQLTHLKQETLCAEPLTPEAASVLAATPCSLTGDHRTDDYRRRVARAPSRRDGPTPRRALSNSLDRADRPGGSVDKHRHEPRHRISDHHGHDLRADSPSHGIRARKPSPA